MQRVVSTVDASHELIGTSVVNQEAAHSSSFEIGRAPLARFAWFVVVYNVAVILWGAYVRASGSGAGCGSHWPTCNGEVIPRPHSAATIIEFTHRATSGLCLVFIVAQLVWALRIFPRGHGARRAAGAAAAFIVSEAAIG